MAKKDLDKADEAPAKPAVARQRIEGARFLGGAWYASDGSPLTPEESRKVHQFQDAQRLKARGGEE